MNNETRTVRVARKTTEALDIASFELVAPEGGTLPSFDAGSHIDVHLPGGLVRQYSLCNDPAESHRYLIGVLHDAASRGGSREMHQKLREGDLLHISAPKNHFALAKDARRSLLLAGGIGITPILCMAEQLAVLGAEFEMHYCTRSKERTAFIARIAGSRFAPHVHFHHDDGAEGQRVDLESLLRSPQSGVHLYVCGPSGFMKAVLEAARKSGWPEQQLHYEFFSSSVPPSLNDQAFEVQLASSGQMILVKKGQTIVQALAAVGVDVPTSCEQGVCGTCLTRVLGGEPDHKDMYLTPDEQAKNDQMLVCCSRARTERLVLDI